MTQLDDPSHYTAYTSALIIYISNIQRAQKESVFMYFNNIIRFCIDIFNSQSHTKQVSKTGFSLSVSENAGQAMIGLRYLKSNYILRRKVVRGTDMGHRPLCPWGDLDSRTESSFLVRWILQRQEEGRNTRWCSSCSEKYE